MLPAAHRDHCEHRISWQRHLETTHATWWMMRDTTCPPLVPPLKLDWIVIPQPEGRLKAEHIRCSGSSSYPWKEGLLGFTELLDLHRFERYNPLPNPSVYVFKRIFLSLNGGHACHSK